MPRVCTVCVHTDKEAIDKALVAGEAYRAIAQRFAASPDAVYRHRAHIPVALAKASEAAEVVRADSLLAQVKALQARALGLLDKAEAAGDLRAATGAIREARATMELVAKLVGELDERAQINVLHIDSMTAAQMREDLAARLARTIQADPASLAAKPVRPEE